MPAAEQRDAFTRVAKESGLAVRFPTEAELRGWGIGTEAFPAAVADPAPGEILVFGTLAWSEAVPGWVGAWTTRWDGRDHVWRVSAVSYDAAFADIIRGVVLLASGHGAPD